MDQVIGWINFYSKQNVEKISLSVDKRNRAIRLYERYNFKIFSESETAFTMVKVIKQQGLRNQEKMTTMAR